MNKWMITSPARDSQTPCCRRAGWIFLGGMDCPLNPM